MTYLDNGELAIITAQGFQVYDSYFQPRKTMDDNHVLLPIPTTVLDDNSNLEQNPGY